MKKMLLILATCSLFLGNQEVTASILDCFKAPFSCWIKSKTQQQAVSQPNFAGIANPNLAQKIGEVITLGEARGRLKTAMRELNKIQAMLNKAQNQTSTPTSKRINNLKTLHAQKIQQVSDLTRELESLSQKAAK